MILVELGERAFEGELAARDLQTLDELAGAHEQHAPSVVDEGEPEGCREMAFARAWRSSDILPGIRTPEAGSSTHFTRGVARRPLLFDASVSKARRSSSYTSSMGRWPMCLVG